MVPEVQTIYPVGLPPEGGVGGIGGSEEPEPEPRKAFHGLFFATPNGYAPVMTNRAERRRTAKLQAKVDRTVRVQAARAERQVSDEWKSFDISKLA